MITGSKAKSNGCKYLEKLKQSKVKRMVGGGTW
jgi:hypothetical protein